MVEELKMGAIMVALGEGANKVKRHGEIRYEGGVYIDPEPIALDINKDGLPDGIVVRDDFIIINERFRKVSGRYGIGRKQPATPEESRRATEEFQTGLSLATKVFADFKKALSEKEGVYLKDDSGIPRAYYKDSSGRETSVAFSPGHLKFETLKDLKLALKGLIVDEFHFETSDHLVVISDPKLLAPIQKRLDAICRLKIEANLKKGRPKE